MYTDGQLAGWVFKSSQQTHHCYSSRGDTHAHRYAALEAPSRDEKRVVPYKTWVGGARWITVWWWGRPSGLVGGVGAMQTSGRQSVTTQPRCRRPQRWSSPCSCVKTVYIYLVVIILITDGVIVTVLKNYTAVFFVCKSIDVVSRACDRVTINFKSFPQPRYGRSSLARDDDLD